MTDALSRPGVAVLGMHRSGTSAVTGALSYAGLRLPREEYLLPPHPDNPRGYFENRVLVELNDRLLRAMGGHWDAPPQLPVGWARRGEMEPLRKEAKDAFQETMPPTGWLWKDPRNCLTMPFWLDVLGDRPAIVFVHRGPAEIVRSLGAREGSSPHLGLALWEHYMHEALRNMAGLPVVVTKFEAVLEAPVDVVDRICEDLGLLGVEIGERDEAGIADFVSSSLTSSTPEARVIDAELSSEQRGLREVIEGLETRYAAFPELELPATTGWTTSFLHDLRRHAEDRTRYLEERERWIVDRDALRSEQKELKDLIAHLRARYKAEIDAQPRWWRNWRRARRRIGSEDQETDG